ncbi:histidine triad (HIT) family protein [Lewinella marina]|uniref:HIT family protein n=1 Tax=Neolewinella marina TaxID=438751 RepID=A0A2G0CJ74_9BACT|nr:HIT family protein [Neolewinella marina]NJB84816.1 histidine triad (HIT) family protein [Neolewinella marina]PHL00026.1 HIT family protein [Neolewinella marina]
MASIFTRIINRELPGYIVAETDDFIAFLDVRPMMEGHTLCVPKREVDYYYDLTDEEITGLTLFSKRVARGIQQVVDCQRIANGVLGLEVPHVHVHLVPVTHEGDFRFGKTVAVSEERMKELQQQISAAITLD